MRQVCRRSTAMAVTTANAKTNGLVGCFFPFLDNRLPANFGTMRSSLSRLLNAEPGATFNLHLDEAYDLGQPASLGKVAPEQGMRPNGNEGGQFVAIFIGILTPGPNGWKCRLADTDDGDWGSPSTGEDGDTPAEAIAAATELLHDIIAQGGMQHAWSAAEVAISGLAYEDEIFVLIPGPRDVLAAGESSV